MTSVSCMSAISRNRPPHRGQATTSNPNVLLIKAARFDPGKPSTNCLDSLAFEGSIPFGSPSASAKTANLAPGCISVGL